MKPWAQFRSFVFVFGVTMGTVGGVSFDYHSVRGRKPVALDGLREGETLAMRGTSREQNMDHYGAGVWSGGAHLLWHGTIGESMETLRWNGEELKRGIDLYAPKVGLAKLLGLGELALSKGRQTISIELTGAHPKATRFQEDRYLLGLDYVKLEALDPPIEEDEVSEPASAPVLVAQLDEMRPVMADFCFRCHGGEKTEGKIDLKALTTKQHFFDDIELTRKVVEALEFKEDERQLPAKERAQLVGMFRGYVDEFLQEQSTLPPTVMRRMNRYEYNNAVRDLLSLKGDIFALPEKPLRAMKPYFDPDSGHFPDTVRVSNRALEEPDRAASSHGRDPICDRPPGRTWV